MPNRDQLVFKALCVLDEAIDQARAGRVPPSLGLRFALAFLYAVGDRRREWFDREPYDDFWRLATQRDEAGCGMECSAAATARQVMMYAAFNGIWRALERMSVNKRASTLGLALGSLIADDRNTHSRSVR